MDTPPLTRAPKPITPVRGGSWRPPVLPSESPQNLATYYPNNLKVQTWDVISRAIKEFPQQSRIFDLCRKVLAKLSRALCGEVQAARLRADLAPSLMTDLLHSLLVYNVRDDSERYRLEQELKGRRNGLASFADCVGRSSPPDENLTTIPGIR